MSRKRNFMQLFWSNADYMHAFYIPIKSIVFFYVTSLFVLCSAFIVKKSGSHFIWLIDDYNEDVYVYCVGFYKMP